MSVNSKTETPRPRAKKQRSAKQKTNANAAPNHAGSPEFLHAPSQYVLSDGVKFVARDYPLELIATIASRLVRGPEDQDYTEAAERAVSLLTACDLLRDSHTIARREVKEMVERTWDYPTDPRFVRTPIVPFKVGVGIITAQKRTDRAEERYRKYLKYCSPEMSNDELDREIVARRESGFYALMVEADRKRFEEFNAAGLLGRRPPRKKTF